MNKSPMLKTLDGFSITAVHTVSKGKAVVLWLHGITVDKDEYLGFFKDGAEYLAARGVDSLRIDFRGHGTSSGTSLDFSIVGQMLDVECALTYLKRSYSHKGVNVHIVGCSFGAPPAIYAAAHYPQFIKGIVLIAPVLSYRRTFLEPETEWARSIFSDKALATMAKTKKLYINQNFPISVRLVEEMKLIQPELALKDIRQDVVIVHGDADSMVPYKASRDITRDLKIKFVPIADMDHGFMDRNDDSGIGTKSLKNKARIFEIVAKHCL